MDRRSLLFIVGFAVACGDGDVTSESASESQTGAETSTSDSASDTDSLTGTMSASETEDPTAGTEGMTDSGSTDPTTEGPTTDPSTTDPSTTDPSTTDPSTTDPSTTDPSTTTSSDLCELTPPEAGDIPVVEACEGEEVMEVIDPWNFSVEWQYTIAGNGSITMPAVGNVTDDNNDGMINGDDLPDIAITGWTSGTLVLLHGDGSGVIYTLNGIKGNAGAAIADVDSDGEPEVLAFLSNNSVIAVDHSGNIEWTSPALPNISNYPQIAVGDLDMDGDPEVIADTAILEGATGALKTSLNATGPWRTPVVADIDLDGHQEIILHSGVFSSTGANLWTIPGSGSASFAAVANIDDDDFAEVFVNYGNNMYVHEHDGTPITNWPIPNNTNLSGPPCMADFDGDGEVEIAVPAGSQFDMMEVDGTLIWQSPINDSSGAAGCSGYDVNGDGTYEVMFADQQFLRIYDGPTGTVVYENGTHNSGTVWEYPVVADVDGDGSGEIIVVSNGGQVLGVTIFGHDGDGWAAAGPAWPIHDFAVTNIGADCSIPQEPEPSWLTHNVFRARPVVDKPALPDLLVTIHEICKSCSTDEVHVTYQVCNQGGLDVDAGQILSLFAVDMGMETLIETQTLPAIGSGVCATGDMFVFDPALLGDGGIVARLYDDGMGSEPDIECDLTNDQDAAELTGCDDAPG